LQYNVSGTTNTPVPLDAFYGKDVLKDANPRQKQFQNAKHSAFLAALDPALLSFKNGSPALNSIVGNSSASVSVEGDGANGLKLAFFGSGPAKLVNTPTCATWGFQHITKVCPKLNATLKLQANHLEILAPILRAAADVNKGIDNLSKAVPHATNADTVKVKMDAVIAKTTEVVDLLNEAGKPRSKHPAPRGRGAGNVGRGRRGTRNARGGTRASDDATKKSPCRMWQQYGNCHRHQSNACDFGHDPADQGPSVQADQGVRGRGGLWGRGIGRGVMRGGRGTVRGGRGARGGAAAAFTAAHPQCESSHLGQSLLKAAAESEGTTYEWHPPLGMIESGMGGGSTYFITSKINVPGPAENLDSYAKSILIWNMMRKKTSLTALMTMLKLTDYMVPWHSVWGLRLEMSLDSISHLMRIRKSKDIIMRNGLAVEPVTYASS